MFLIMSKLLMQYDVSTNNLSFAELNLNFKESDQYLT